MNLVEVSKEMDGSFGTFLSTNSLFQNTSCKWEIEYIFTLLIGTESFIEKMHTGTQWGC